MRFNRRHILLIILVLALLTLFLPIKINYSFDATAMIFPVKEWHLKRGQDDSYISEMTDFHSNVMSEMKSYKFERGDISEVNLRESLKNGKHIQQSDTIAYINSYFIETELVKLKNLKEMELEALKVGVVGEKQELIDAAVQNYEFAKKQLDLEEKKYNRHHKLYKDSIISTADFEIYENAYNLASINVDITYNQLLSLQTGVKPEEVKYIEQQIQSYSREIETLEKLKQQYYIISPIGGIVSYNKVLNGIVTISDTSEYILKIPVQVRNIQYLRSISGIKFSIPGYTEEIDASFVDLDENVNFMSNKQLVMAKALITGGQFKLYPGMAVQCKVICDEITLLDYLRRGITIRL